MPQVRELLFYHGEEMRARKPVCGNCKERTYVRKASEVTQALTNKTYYCAKCGGFFDAE